jgi:uncharacterized protein YaaQ
MKMIMVVVHRDDAPALLDALVASGYHATFMDCRGGFLRQGRVSIFMGAQPEEVSGVLDVIRNHCRAETEIEPAHSVEGTPVETAPVRVSVGGAVVFVWDIERFETY